MKKIGIDVRLYSQTGVGTYIRNLIHHLISAHTQNLQFILYLLPEDIEKLPPLPSNFTIRAAPYRWHTIQEQWQFFLLIRRDALDLMHFTYFGFPILYNRLFISTIHDITPLLHRTGKASTKNPVYYFLKSVIFKLVLFLQVKNARFIIVPSEYVKHSIIDFFGVKYKNKLTVMYEGVNFELMNAKQNLLLEKSQPKDFYMYIGNFYPHKNIEGLIVAVSQLKNPPHILLIGPEDYFSERLKDMILKMNLQTRIRFFHHASNSDLVFFYKHAKALIHPSFSEGFGLTVIEALYFNCPIIVSDIPIFRELLGLKALYFDPKNSGDIAAKINQIEQQKSQVNTGIKLPLFLSFKSMTAKTLDYYTKSLNHDVI